MAIPIITTKDKELYNKLRSLRYTDEVVITPKNNNSLSKIINKINEKNNNINTEKIGNRLILKRLKPFNFHIKHRKTP